MKIIQRIEVSGRNWGYIFNLPCVKALRKIDSCITENGIVGFSLDPRKIVSSDDYAMTNYGVVGDTIVEYENHLWGVIPKNEIEKETNVK